VLSAIPQNRRRPGGGLSEFRDRAARRPPILRSSERGSGFTSRTRRALFTVGEEQVVGVGGQILVVPALVSHRFEVLDGGTYEATHIHASDRFITEWLE
jgi:hypothetical protein